MGIKSHKLNATVRRRLNKELQDLSSKYYPNIPLDKIMKILKGVNIIILQEDYTEWSGFLMGQKAQVYFDIAYNWTLNKDGMYEPFDNVSLNLSWHRMQSGNYEINVYIT